MGLIPQVKCSRCDRKYSGLLAKCPYCGARRRKKSARAVTNDNSTWKMVVGLLLLVVLIAAVVVLVVTSISENKNNDTDEVENNPSGISSLDGGVNSTGDPATVDPGTIPDDEQGLPVDDEPEEEEPAAPAVNSVIITYAGSQVGMPNDQLGMREFTMKLLDKLQLGVTISPEDAEGEPLWASDDENVVIVYQDGKIEAVGTGTAVISVTVGGVTSQVFVRVRS